MFGLAFSNGFLIIYNRNLNHTSYLGGMRVVFLGTIQLLALAPCELRSVPQEFYSLQ